MDSRARTFCETLFFSSFFSLAFFQIEVLSVNVLCFLEFVSAYFVAVILLEAG